MKYKYLLVLVLILCFTLVSCEKSKEEKLIAEYAQTLGDAKMDLNFKMKKLEKFREITAKDSAAILRAKLEEKKNKTLEQLNKVIGDSSMLKYYIGKLEHAKKNKFLEHQIWNYEKSVEEEKGDIEKAKNYIALYKPDFVGTYLEPLYVTIKNYESYPSQLLVTEYNATYSIENPLLNNQEQEFSRRFLINGDLTKVIQVE